MQQITDLSGAAYDLPIVGVRDAISSYLLVSVVLAISLRLNTGRLGVEAWNYGFAKGIRQERWVGSCSQ